MNAVRMSVAGIGLAVLLSGCAAPSPPASPPASVTGKQEIIQSNREKEMVLLFQSLVQMDKRDGLAISTKQAANLLPLIRRNSSEGELAQADQKVITALLTGEQKQFVDDFMEVVRKRIETIKQLKEQQGLSEEERESMIREFLSKRRQEKEGALPPPRRTPEDGAHAGPAGGPPGGKNVEQQLIDLLEAKLRKEPGK